MNTLQHILAAARELLKATSPNTVLTVGDFVGLLEKADNEAKLQEYEAEERKRIDEENKSWMQEEHPEDYDQPPIHLIDVEGRKY